MTQPPTFTRRPVALERCSCPKCGRAESRVVLSGPDRLHGIAGEFVVAECLGCRFWYQNPHPAADEILGLYPPNYLPHLPTPIPEVTWPLTPAAVGYLRQKLGYPDLVSDQSGRPWPLSGWLTHRVQQWRAGVRLVPRFIAGGKLLEIGCGAGDRLRFLRRLGWSELHGIEPVRRAAAASRTIGFAIREDAVELALPSYPDEHFDVIVASMVLEHLLRPFDVVRLVARKLRAGGEFLFSTVVRDSLDARLFGAFWSGFDFPRHMVYFRKSDLRDLLKDDFTDIVYYHQADLIDFVRPATWRRHAGLLVDRWILALARSRIGRPLNWLLASAALTCRVSIRCRRR